MSTSQLDLLRALGRGVLAQPIDIVADDRTAYSPAENRILVARSYLDASSPVAVGALLHETGHVNVSRYNLFKVPSNVWSKLWLQSLNAVEEARANLFMTRRWPGAQAPLAALFATDPKFTGDSFESALLAFLMAAAACDRKASFDFLDSFPKARAAFVITAQARELYAETLPPADFSAHPRLADRYDRLVKPLLLPARQDDAVDPVEAEARCAAASAYLLFRQHIWPEIWALFCHDRDRIVHALSAAPELRAMAERANNANARGAAAQQALRRAATELPDDAVMMWPRRRATRLLRAYLDRALTPAALATASATRSFERRAGISYRALRAAAAARRAAAAAAAPDVEALVTVLRRALPRSPRQWQGGFRSGSGIDVAAAMQAAATGRDSDKIWLRRSREMPLLAVTILVDLSGSMGGKKIEAAIAATRALAVALTRISQIRWSVSGFQDKPIPLIKFGERATREALARLEEMRLEVAGIRPDGNNRPRINDDGPVVKAICNEIACRPEPDRLVVVISDGLPEAGPDAPSALRAAVADVQAMNGVTLVGLGLGPGTEHVREFYPVSRANVVPAALAEVLGQLLADRLRAHGTTA